MRINMEFDNALCQAENEYDIIGCCYCELLKYIDDQDSVFITKIVHLSNDIQYGGYVDRFEELRQSILGLAEQMNMNEIDAGIGFDVFCKKILQQLRNFNCPEELDENMSVSICMFYVLEALDCYVRKNLELVNQNYW